MKISRLLTNYCCSGLVAMNQDSKTKQGFYRGFDGARACAYVALFLQICNTFHTHLEVFHNAFFVIWSVIDLFFLV